MEHKQTSTKTPSQMLVAKEYKQFAEFACHTRKTFLDISVSVETQRAARQRIVALRELLNNNNNANDEVVRALPDIDTKLYFCNPERWCHTCQKDCKRYCRCMHTS